MKSGLTASILQNEKMVADIKKMTGEGRSVEWTCSPYARVALDRPDGV